MLVEVEVLDVVCSLVVRKRKRLNAEGCDTELRSPLHSMRGSAYRYRFGVLVPGSFVSKLRCRLLVEISKVINRTALPTLKSSGVESTVRCVRW